MAAQNGSVEACRYLLSVPNVDVEARDAAGTTALHAAAWGCHVEVCKVLLEVGGATVNVQAEDGSTPLHLCASSAPPESEGEKLDFQARTAATCQLLMSRPGAATDIQDKEGLTPLHIATSAGNSSMTRLLLSASPREVVSLPTPDGRTCLHLAATSGSIQVLEDVMSHLSGVEELERVDGDMWTALHGAAAGGHAGCVSVLVERCPGMVVMRDGEGCTAMHLAATYGAVDSLKVFLENEMCVLKEK
ncbi:hypothetical protein HDU67_005452, partial [Dinochytrium kinnereticum]